MKFIEQRLPGVFLIELDRHTDERGFFARSFCVDELARAGLHTEFPQGNVSFNARRHTLRGMHYNAAPHGEVKIVSCTAGAILDVVIDLRAGSPTRLTWCAVELTPATGDIVVFFVVPAAVSAILATCGVKMPEKYIDFSLVAYSIAVPLLFNVLMLI